jgi:hypothetical protein
VSGKASKAEVTARVETIFELRLGGAGFADIRQYASAPTDSGGKKLDPWQVSDRQLWRYIAAADKLCQERFDAKAPHLLAQHLLRRERLFAHATETGDWRTALAVLKDSAELQGHYDRRPELPAQPDPADTTALDASAVVRMLSARLREIDRAELPPGGRARLTAQTADALLRALGVADLAQQLAELRAAMDRLRNDQHAGNDGKAGDPPADGAGPPPPGAGQSPAGPAAG